MGGRLAVSVHKFFPDGLLVGYVRRMAPRATRGARSLKAAAKASRGAASKFEAAPVERKRHDVVGQRKPRAPKSSSAARKRSEAERRETLAVEYRNQHRSNVLIDGRFGEADDNLPAEEKQRGCSARGFGRRARPSLRSRSRRRRSS